MGFARKLCVPRGRLLIRLSTRGRARPLIIVATLFGLTAQAGAASVGEGSQTPPRIERIDLYVGGLLTGGVTLRFADAKLTAVGYLIPASGQGIPMVQDRVSQREINQLRRLMDDSRLRAFVPKAEWFDRTPPKYPLEGSSDLVITWTDRRVVLGIPPSDVRLRVPRDGSRIYASLDKISDLLFTYAREHANGSGGTLTMVTRESPEWTTFEMELHRVWKESLPKDRKSW